MFIIREHDKPVVHSTQTVQTRAQTKVVTRDRYLVIPGWTMDIKTWFRNE